MRAMPLLIVMLIVAACSGTAPNPVGSSTSSTEAGPVIIAATTTTLPTTTTTDPTTTTTSAFARPDWLGTHLLPLRPDGHGEVQPTPAELVDRQLETVDLLDPPSSSQFESTIEAIPPAVLARSSWQEGCPVVSEDLRYLTMSHYGFDGELHTGEMIVNAAVAEDVAEVFARLHEARYPIEQMRVIRADEVDDQPTGDWNETTSFVCRPAVGSEN